MTERGNQPLPRFPAAPRAYSTAYFNRLVSLLDQLTRQLQSRRRIEVTQINMSQCPSTGAGLREGDIFCADGVLHIVQPDKGYPESLMMTASVGTVTVTTS